MPRDPAEPVALQLGNNTLHIRMNEFPPSQVAQNDANLTAKAVRPRTPRRRSQGFVDEVENIDAIETLQECIAVALLKPCEKLQTVAPSGVPARHRKSSHVAEVLV